MAKFNRFVFVFVVMFIFAAVALQSVSAESPLCALEGTACADGCKSAGYEGGACAQRGECLKCYCV
ncbi:hypothetical protein HA402_006820 [Bradysia odoriphaga]|nr:hypothetical protein HA402_006820 [Bradysia odoriphaga]